MKNYRTVLLILLLSLLGISLLAGCTPKQEDELTLPKKETPALEESQTVEELQTLQSKYDQLNTDYETVKNELKTEQAQYDELNKQHSELTTKYNELNTKYNELNTNYNELSSKYDTLMQGTAGISEADVEQEIFELINQNRQSSGLNELEWTDSIYKYAIRHSGDMAAAKKLEYADLNYSQDVFRAAGYSTVDRIAHAALTIWKESQQYEDNFLNVSSNYGVVATTKSGEIFYITYFASSQK
ncbi:CAP domain-containing protein [Chloroflexota bacterium]